MSGMSNEGKKQCVLKLDDLLIVQKILQKDPPKVTEKDGVAEATQCLCFKTECDCEGNLLAEEEEAIAKKQLQMLQADERGKQALMAEMAALKKAQEQRLQWFRNRQQALETEKCRAKKIASLPPPMPKSVKMLLKQTEEPTTNEPDVLMPEELTATAIKPVDPNYENKENIIDPEVLEARQKEQEERQVKAKLRFNEALRKDRQKMEYSAVMKQIQNAEFFNRQEMAKNISSEKKSMPCPLSDKLNYFGKQADMEDAAERVFKKCDVKEHIIEDIEGYQDQYEEKFKKIDSNFEAKMTDCIPDFIKENYEYLLEDESKFVRGRKFSGLNDSNFLNVAYIETSPETDELDGRTDIDVTISHLDRFRYNFQEKYEQTLKPLLIAAMETPKKKLTDKAVETESMSVTAEDKAVETDMQFKLDLTTPPPYPIFDYKNSGVMAFKKRSHAPLGNFRAVPVPSMYKREVFYPAPSAKQSEYSTPSPASSSSYCSLPSEHGMPLFPSNSDPVKCDICIAEMQKDSQSNLSKLESNIVRKSEKTDISTEKTQLSDCIKQIAQKYLSQKSTSRHLPKERTLSESSLPVRANMQSTDATFEKKIVSKSETELMGELQRSKETSPDACSLLNEAFYLPSETIKSPDTIPKVVRNPKPDQQFLERNESSNKLEKNYLFESNQKVKSYETITNPIALSDGSRRIPRFTFDCDTKSEDNEMQTVQDRLVVKPHIYHELSTIQEQDSALTANSQLSQTKLSDVSGETAVKKVFLAGKSEGDRTTKGLTFASLLDPPTSQISELAKSIHFIPETEENEESHSKSCKGASPGHESATPVSSKDNSWPSCTSDSNSISSGTKIFSSTLTGTNLKYPHLKDVKTLPDYFKDISDIQKKDSSSEKSSVQISEFFTSTPSSSSSVSVPSVVSTKSKENAVVVPVDPRNTSGFGSLSMVKSNVMTCQEDKCSVTFKTSKTKDRFPFIGQKITINVSRYLSDSETPNVSESVFNPMTPHSSISSPSVCSNTGDSKNVCDNQSSSVKSFKAMTPQSNISSPSELASRFEHQNFKPLTPQSDISSSRVEPIGFKNDESFKSARLEKLTETKFKHKDSDSVTSFKALTPHSHITTPSESTVRPPDDFKDKVHSGSSGSYSALTPTSVVSSQSSSDEKELLRGKSSNNSDSNSLKLRPDTSAGSLSPNGTHSFESRIPRSLSYNLFTKVLNLEDKSSVTDDRPINLVDANKMNKVAEQKESSETKAKKCASVSSIDGNSEELRQCNSVVPVLIEGVEDKCPEMIENFSGKTLSEKQSNENAEDCCQKPKNYEAERSQNFYKPKNNLVAVSSSNSSCENLSEISGSKVVCQSTPVKNISELIKEPGLLEEPDLTLVADLTGAANVSRNLSSLISDKRPVSPKQGSAPSLSADNYGTPTSSPQQSFGTPETPSMMSFLQHEMSCMVKNVSGQSSKGDAVTPSTSENNTPQLNDDKGARGNAGAFENKSKTNEAKPSPFMKITYKDRTKRLWNNLEEVKRKKEIDEKKKLIVINRMKAKEFAKKITPQKKGK